MTVRFSVMREDLLRGKRVLLGVTGGIAAYKAPFILRLLVQGGADVRVVMTEAATQFAAPATLEVLSRHPVYTDLFARSDEFPVLHVGLAHWADLVIVAPATANTMARIAHGLADDLLSALILSTTAPVIVASAMEEEMLLKPQVQENGRKLLELGFGWVEPASGELASGSFGRGRMAEPDAIVAQAAEFLAHRQPSQGGDLADLALLVTAGPTLEDIDPVRYIGNRSTGKMGYAIASRAGERGARVHLVSGPTALSDPVGVEVQRVRSAAQMLVAATAVFDGVDAAVLAAAVADYTVRSPSTEKIKRESETLSLDLVRNPDIAAVLGEHKKEKVLVGFAAETESGFDRAREKLRRKKLDLIVLNNVLEEGAGFASDTNRVTLIDAADEVVSLPRMAKLAVADRLLDRVRDLCRSRGRKPDKTVH